MEFSSADRYFIIELLRKGSVNFYALHESYRLSPAQIADSLMRLRAIGVLDEPDIGDGVVKLSRNGLQELVSYRREIFHRLDEWKNVPTEMKVDALGINAPYIPNFRKLGSGMRARQRQIRKELKVRGHAG